MNKLLFFLVLLALSHLGFSQCLSSVKVAQHKTEQSKLTNTKPGIDVSVKSKGRFTATLYKLNSLTEVEISSFAGVGNENFKFENLMSETLYRVKVVFHDETEFLCRKKVSEDLILTEN